MCVICFSPKGVEAPTEEQITDMFYANPDGAGYAYEEGRTVKYKKGFMCVEDLLNELKPLEQWKNKNLALHFRIGTAGENDAHTCHPFPITTSYGEMRKTEGEGAVLFHNGIIADGGMIDSNSSDTQDFVAAFAPLLKKYSKSKARDKWLEDITKGNRMLIMYGNNKYKMYGQWEKDGDLLVSNTNYKYTRRYYTSSYDSVAPSWYGEWEKYWVSKQKKALAKDMLENLERDQYVWATVSEIDAMLELADEYDDKTMTIDGVVYNYDLEGEVVWAGIAEY